MLWHSNSVTGSRAQPPPQKLFSNLLELGWISILISSQTFRGCQVQWPKIERLDCFGNHLVVISSWNNPIAGDYHWVRRPNFLLGRLVAICSGIWAQNLNFEMLKCLQCKVEISSSYKLSLSHLPTLPTAFYPSSELLLSLLLHFLSNSHPPHTVWAIFRQKFSKTGNMKYSLNAIHWEEELLLRGRS